MYRLVGIISVGVSISALGMDSQARGRGILLDDVESVEATPLNFKEGERFAGMREEAAKISGRASFVEKKPFSGTGLRAHSDAEERFNPDGTGTDWNAPALPDDKNFCALLNEKDANGADLLTQIGSCSTLAEPACDTERNYVLLGDGQYSICEWTDTIRLYNEDGTRYYDAYDANESTNMECIFGAANHSCPWTIHMQHLENMQRASTVTCFSDLLEAKRSLDGLLHAVNETYAGMMLQSAIISTENETIQAAITDERDAAAKLLNDQWACDNISIQDNVTLDLIWGEIYELQRIAQPEIRSHISTTFDYSISDGYYEKSALHADTSFDNVLQNQRNAHAAELLRKGRDGELIRGFSFVETGDHGGLDQVNVMSALLMGACNQDHVDLQGNFTVVYLHLTSLYDIKNLEIQTNRTWCYLIAQNEYNTVVYGVGGVDERIEGAANRIRAAQRAVAELEPRLHDLEHAVHRMRDWITELNGTCTVEADVNHHLYDLGRLIKLLGECPGRNDFKIEVPHWDILPPPNPGGGDGDATPVPTPWRERVDDNGDLLDQTAPDDADEITTA